MKIFLHAYILAVLLYFIIPETAHAQINENTALNNLFDEDSVLEITLSGNIRELLNDRSDNAKYHDLNITYTGKGNEIIIPAEAKTRGHFRRMKENCFYPPLLIHFSAGDTLMHSIFKDQNKLKLVMPCKGDEYVIHEWLVYKLYNLITPESFRARLAHVTFNDAKNKKPMLPFYCIMLEEEKQMAKRNGLVAVNRKIKPEQTAPDAFIKMAVFEYLIGNTDWSVQYMQNIKLLAPDSNAVATTVPYDFDHAGIVNAPYAQPAEELLMNSVRERRYRGYCMQDMKKFDSAIALFNRLKPAIYNLYSDCLLLDDKYKKATIKYLDDFYSVINDPVKMQKEFGYPCDKNGTGNVVIKGLKED